MLEIGKDQAGSADIDFKKVAFKKAYQQFTFQSMVIHLKLLLVQLSMSAEYVEQRLSQKSNIYD